MQKERDYAKEMTKQVEEMKAKVYSIRAQKMDLDSQVIEMQSTISSLKDEQRTMELALEEKRAEIKLLRDKEMDMGKRDLEESSLKEILKQKEIEIANLKRQVESLNLSTREGGKKEEMNKLEEREERGQSRESSENSTLPVGAEETERNVNVSEVKMLAEKEKLHVQGNTTEDPPKGDSARENNGVEALGMNTDSSAGSQDEQNSINKRERNDLNATGTATLSAMEVSEVTEGKADMKKLEEREKLEQPGNISDPSGPTIQREFSDGKGSRSRGKRWRALARKRRLEGNNNSATMKHHRFIEDAIEIMKRKQAGDNAANGQDQDMNAKKTNEPDQISSLLRISQDFNGGNQERKEDGHGFESQGNGQESPKEEKEHETVSGLRDQSNGEVPATGSLVSNPRIPMNGGENRTPEVGIGEAGSQEGDTAIENISKDTDRRETGHTEEEVPDYAEKEVREADVKDSQESETERIGGDFFKGSAAKVEEPRDEYKEEETYQSDF